MSDVEVLDGGMTVTRLNGPALRTDRVFWNDTPMLSTSWDGQANGKCGLRSDPLTTDAVEGVSSEGGAHRWNAAGCDGGNINGGGKHPGGPWGNNRHIDTWAYVDVDESDPIQEPIAVAGFEVTKQATPSSEPLEEDGFVDYVITATPVPYAHEQELTTPVETWNGRFSDDLTGVLDDAILTSDLKTLIGGAAAVPPATSQTQWQGSAPESTLWT